ncbi:hypothetical protein HPB47_017447 [Ixodes persulcatus]|uniref:Uncharacterized protein n=1 Tax=Ixodes persulcatus TaxID=34615 RepID=A0AC60QN96_IXOPE|nr:hypothetical protein HPB47_017447 [Ixodes persulcatus]
MEGRSMPAIHEMGDCAKLDMSSFRVAEFSDALDWRPMLFQEPVIAQRACALCGVVYKKAVRLPCAHTLCTKCHAQCVNKGSACPVDQEPFCEKDLEKLELSAEYILNRKVVCWNASSGCSFIGTTASVLDHYKECGLSVVPCCLCRSSVLQCDILEHFKNGCSIHEAKCGPSNSPATEDLKDISRACLEMKRAIERISEDLVSLQTSLNRCSEDVKVEGEKCKVQWETEASRVAEQLRDLSTVCTTQAPEAMQIALQAALADYKKHVSKELSLLSLSKPKRVHWYIEGWADLKKEALESGLEILLDLVEDYPLLYDKRHPDYKNKTLKSSIWKIIGSEFGMEGHVAESKFKNARDKYTRIQVDARNRQRSGAGASEVPKVRWAYFARMRALLDSGNEEARDESSPRERVGVLNPHLLFLHFLTSLGNDHTTLVDLVTSDETCALLYFVRYLKLVLSDWDAFLASHKCFENSIRANEFTAEDTTAVTDRTMAVLIRLRMKLERMSQKGLVPFNVGPLLRLIERCESLYEEAS